MKTTLEIPDPLFRRAKSAAAERGISLRALVTEALADKLRASGDAEKPWMKSFGKLRSLHKETVRINQIIADEFGKVQPEIQMVGRRHAGVGRRKRVPHPAVR